MTSTAWLMEHWGLIATGLWVLCELLNQIPSIKSNTIGQLMIGGILNLVKDKVIAKPVVQDEPPKP